MIQATMVNKAAVAAVVDALQQIYAEVTGIRCIFQVMETNRDARGCTSGVSLAELAEKSIFAVTETIMDWRIPE